MVIYLMIYILLKIIGVKQTLVKYGKTFEEYRTQYQSAETPYVVSELRNKVKIFYNYF
jgi:hypothetical protein